MYEDIDITVILNLYRRPQNLTKQINAIKLQTIKPKEVWVWKNYHSDNKNLDLRQLNIDKYFDNNYNWKFYGRFAAALLVDTKYIAIFDDDTIPGKLWFENCANTIGKVNGILGSAGVVLNSWNYINHTRHGWPTKNEEIIQVDLVGHAWFFKREWLSYLWREKPFTWENGEDIQFSYLSQKYGNIKTYCPPHPKDNFHMHGSILGNELGIDKVATSCNNDVCINNFFSQRTECIVNAIKNGWETINNIELG